MIHTIIDISVVSEADVFQSRGSQKNQTWFSDWNNFTWSKQAQSDKGEERERCRVMRWDAWYTDYCFSTICRHSRPFRGCIYLAQETFLEGLKGGNLEEAEVFTSTAPSSFISCPPCFWGADVSTVPDHINQPLGCLLGSQVSWPKGGLSSKSESRGATGCSWGPNESCRGSWGVWGISQSMSPLHLGHCKLDPKQIFQIGPKTFIDGLIVNGVMDGQREKSRFWWMMVLFT